jgi:signal transduction histidine kinase
MTNTAMTTLFAPAERLPAACLAGLREQLVQLDHVKWLERMPLMIFLADSHRQIVYGNPPFVRAAKPSVQNGLVGLRPGEALGCIFAQEMEAGCGCSAYCRHCGAVQAILKSLRGIEDCRECHILTKDSLGLHAIDVQILARPFIHDERIYSLNIAVDISHERRLAVLNRNFLHNMINAAGGMENMLSMLSDNEDDELNRHVPLLRQSALTMLQEVLYQYDVAAVENGKLAVQVAVHDVSRVVKRLVEQLREHPVSRGRKLLADGPEIRVSTDAKLLRHVLSNLVVNALEASTLGSAVRVSWEVEPSGLRLAVDNTGSMAPEVALQLFKRYVSTKGEDRGLGLYMAKVFAEDHLGGRLAYEPLPGITRFSLYLPNSAPSSK